MHYFLVNTSYENEKNQQLAKFVQILDILNNTFQPTSVQKSSRIKMSNALALQIRLYCSDNWALRQEDTNKLTSR
jgi:hypothetical protein